MPKAEGWTISNASRRDLEAAAVGELRTPEAVRVRCAEVLAAGERDTLAGFALNLERLGRVVDYVEDTIRDNYPDLVVPYHSRWRHFQTNGVDRWQVIANRLSGYSRDEIARIRIELAIISVLLDAGAGDGWRFEDRSTGNIYSRSEGLALASLALYTDGTLSAVPDEALRIDASPLVGIEDRVLTEAFQVGEHNRLSGLDGRVSLLRALGECIAAKPAVFGSSSPRLGRFYDYLLAQARDRILSAREILVAVLTVFAPIWPGRIQIGGENLGDVWPHSAVRRDDGTDTLVPFHKLSQWLTYSLMEPLADAGVTVSGLDQLTGLAEYRNGGLFIDLDVLVPRTAIEAPVDVDSELVVEWRALTVSLLDRLAPLVRERLGVEKADFPLARILQGGTWSAGRKIAAELRDDAGPPIKIRSDGTVF